MAKNPEKKKKAQQILSKLLSAAHTAQKEGKYLALDRIIYEANKLSNRLNKDVHNDYKTVMGEIVEESEDNAKIEKHRELEILKATEPALKAEHNNLAIIAAKQDYLG